MTLREAMPVIRGVARWWADFKVSGPPLPAGPVVVAANHLSHVDPVVVTMAVERPVRFLALDELFGHHTAFDTLLLWLGSIPLTRTGIPLSAMRTALVELAAGGAVAMFPEGRRVAAWGDEWPRRGAAWLSVRSGAPLVPVAITGSGGVMGLEDKRLQRHPVSVTLGEPLHPDEFRNLDDPVTAMTEEWALRIGEALRGVASSE